MGNSCKTLGCEKEKRDMAAAGGWRWSVASALFSKKSVVGAHFSEAGQGQENRNVTGGTRSSGRRAGGDPEGKNSQPQRRRTLLWRHEAEARGTQSGLWMWGFKAEGAPFLSWCRKRQGHVLREAWTVVSEESREGLKRAWQVAGRTSEGNLEEPEGLKTVNLQWPQATELGCFLLDCSVTLGTRLAA